MLKTASNITTIISIVLSTSMLLFMFYLYFFRGWRDRAYLKMKNAYKLYKKHVLDEGDTLWGISQRYGVKLDRIYAMNGLDEWYVPKEGDIIRLR